VCRHHRARLVDNVDARVLFAPRASNHRRIDVAISVSGLSHSLYACERPFRTNDATRDALLASKEYDFPLSAHGVTLPIFRA